MTRTAAGGEYVEPEIAHVVFEHLMPFDGFMRLRADAFRMVSLALEVDRRGALQGVEVFGYRASAAEDR